MNLKDHRIVVTPELEDPQVDFEFHEMFDFEMTDKENDDPEPMPDVTFHPSPPVSEESADETTTTEKRFEVEIFSKTQNLNLEPSGEFIIIEKESSAVDDFLKKQTSISEAYDKKNGITRKRVETDSERVYKKDMKKLQKKGKAIEMKEKIRRQERHVREIAEQMLSDNFAIQTHVFRKVVHSIMDWKHPNFRIHYNAIEALQRETEMMLTKMLRLGWHLSIHAKRKTLQIEDLRELKAILDINKEGSTFMA